MMREGQLWFDKSKDDLGAKVERAAEYLTTKYGQRPNLCFVNPSMLLDGSTSVPGIEIRTTNTVLVHHFWFCVADGLKAPEARPAPQKGITTIDTPRIIPGLQEINEAIQRDLWKAFTGPLMLPAPQAEQQVRRANFTAPAPVRQQVLCLPAPSQLPGPHVDEMWDRYADQILDLIREEKRKAKKAARILQRLLQDEKPLRSETITLGAPKEQPAPQSISRQLADAPAAQPAVLPQALQSPAEAIRQLAEQKAKPAALNVDQVGADAARDYYNAHGYFPKAVEQISVETQEKPAQREVKEQYYNGTKMSHVRNAIKAFKKEHEGIRIIQINLPPVNGMKSDLNTRNNVLDIPLNRDPQIHKGKMQLVGTVSQ